MKKHRFLEAGTHTVEIYTPKFFKNLINRDSVKVEISETEEVRSTSHFSQDLQAFFSFLSSSLSSK